MKRRNDRFTISIYLLPLFLAVFLTACEVRDSYMNAEVISADETSITVRPIKAGDSHAPKGVLEAETLILDLTGYDNVSIPEDLAPGDGIRVLFNPDSFKKGEVPEIGIVFQIYRLDEDGEEVKSHEEISASESSEAPEPGRAVKWFDCLHGDEMVWDDVREYDLEEFPGITFRWTAEQLDAVKGSETTPLYNGMPIWSVYFCDLTGDGKPELCSTLSMGSGIVNDQILVYDYADGTGYDQSVIFCGQFIHAILFCSL
ncbi:MAG: hypothetical protein ACLR9Z_11765, partial [Alitiscatomonas sp.]